MHAKMRNVLFHCPMMTWDWSRKRHLQLLEHVHGNWQGCRYFVNVAVDMWNFCPVIIKGTVIRRPQKLPLTSSRPHIELEQPDES
ncbi:MAG: hypothetical protein OXC72_02170 [Roseovarius sp.]|nr:hypothetical protein [Roseovarius sp.]